MNLEIKNLSINVEDSCVVDDFSIAIFPGSVHALMGKNGSGKSSLAYTIAGHPSYKVTAGSIVCDGLDSTETSPERRVKMGIFLAFQQPPAIPGVTVMSFLKEAHHAVTGEATTVSDFYERLIAVMGQLSIPAAFAYRGLNEGFSGGERKKFEMLQLLLLRPRLAILDEIDSGLDVDALRLVTAALAVARKENPLMSVIIITHYRRLLEYVIPDRIHVLHRGKLVASGDARLADEIEQRGYDEYEGS